MSFQFPFMDPCSPDYDPVKVARYRAATRPQYCGGLEVAPQTLDPDKLFGLAGRQDAPAADLHECRHEALLENG